MRGLWGLVAAIVIAITATGCDPLDRRYLREGIGTDLATPELAEAAALQDIYVGYICQEAGLLVTLRGSVPVCEEAPVTRNWTVFVQAGLNDIDSRCDAYLTWLDNKRRSVGPIHQQILDSQGATVAILAATAADPTKAIAVVAAAFGLAAHSFTNFNSRFLFEVEKSTVQTVVLTRQREYREKLPVNIDNRPAAIYALRQYLRLCMPMTIETQINTTVKLFERGGAAALDRAASRPMIDARTVRTAVIADVRAPLTERSRVRNPGKTRLSPFEESLSPAIMREIQSAVCIEPTGDLGELNSPTRRAISSYLKERGEAPTQILNDVNFGFIDEAIEKIGVRQAKNCRSAGFTDAAAVGRSFAR
jgi:hypothetical protein